MDEQEIVGYFLLARRALFCCIK